MPWMWIIQYTIEESFLSAAKDSKDMYSQTPEYFYMNYYERLEQLACNLY